MPRKTKTDGKVRARLSQPLYQHAVHFGYVVRDVDGVEVAAKLNADGEIETALVDVSGTPRSPGASNWGIVQVARADRSCWSVSDGAGWLEHRFATLEAGIAAVRDPKRLKAMREYGALRRRLEDLRREVDNFPRVDGALPIDW